MFYNQNKQEGAVDNKTGDGSIEDGLNDDTSVMLGMKYKPDDIDSDASEILDPDQKNNVDVVD